MMAKKPESDCSCVIDTNGLHELATASGNLKATLIAHLQDGTIGVPSWAMQEFKELYEDEANELAPYVAKRVQLSTHVQVRAARITEELGLGFSRGAYDSHVERHTAAVALNKGYVVLTSVDNVDAYDGMQCTVKDLAGWAEEYAIS
ncbi:hypothetical protein ACVIW2_007596 [Bradyrhizobium huanghuaihaiense]